MNIRKSLLLLTIVPFLILACCNCDDDSPSNNNNDIVGKTTWTTWQRDAGWADYAAANYSPDAETVVEISQILHDNSHKLLLFASTWCSDCERGVPKIYKILTAANYDVTRMDLYGLDRQKKEPSNTYAQYSIVRVPTLVILKGQTEVGRIVENPSVSWEADMLEILRK
ncbi:MAG: thioredoxin family protein [Chloroflexota bacterium]